MDSYKNNSYKVLRILVLQVNKIWMQRGNDIQLGVRMNQLIKRCFFTVGVSAFLLVGLTSCKKDAYTYPKGAKVSDAYVDPSKEGEVPMGVKAKGYEYDYDSLTYDLVWSDEFDYEGLPDETKWGYDVGGSGWGNNELQYYTDDKNAFVKDGKLIIEARKEEHGGKDYTSARLVTRGKGDWTYGKFEIRAKLPAGLGTWPAIWMLPTDWEYGSWPDSGEIDIMEHVGYDQDMIHCTIHTRSYYHGIGTQKAGTKRIEGVSDDFHTYTVEWLPDKIIGYVDDEEIFTYEPTKYKPNPTFKEWPFDTDFHLLLNIAVGGNWGGSRGMDESVYPVQMEVEYVKVYQSQEITKLVEEVKNAKESDGTK